MEDMARILGRFAFYLRPYIPLTGEAVVCDTTAFAGQGDANQTQSALDRSAWSA